MLAKTEKIRYNYSKTLEHTNLIEERKILTLSVLDQIYLLDQKISGLNTTEFNFTEVFNAQKQIKEKFEKEQIDEIPQIIDNVFAKIDQIQLETTRFKTFFKASQQNIVSFVERHKAGVSISALLLILLTWISYNEIILMKLKRKVEDYKTELEVIKQLLEKAQKDYYKDGIITKSIYEIKLKKYEEKQLKIKEQLPVLEINLEELLESRRCLYLTRISNTAASFANKILKRKK